MKKLFCATVILAMMTALWSCQQTDNQVKCPDPADCVSTLVGSLSDYSFSTGNTYPATARPWGMNFWTPQTGPNGDGWTYSYAAHTIRGLKQTHQPSPWINDYGQFSIMPVRDAAKVSQEDRSSWFSHQSETAKPYYYQVYFADHDINAEMTTTERAAAFRFTYPESATSGLVVDAFARGSSLCYDDEHNAIVGYTTQNSGGVPENFKNWIVVQFDRPIEGVTLYDGTKAVSGTSVVADNALASVRFTTSRGDLVGVRAASSFISLDQAWTNLKELGDKDFDTLKEESREAWNAVLGRFEVSGGSMDQYRTFYSCLYRSVLFPRKFYEINEAGEIVHYSPYNGEICDGYMYTDSGFWDTFRALFPLLNLAYPSVNAEIQAGLANTYRESGFLPEWASPGHRGCMVGNNSASIVTDAILSGIEVSEEDIATLYEAVVHGTEAVHPEISSTGRIGHEYYNTLGYVPCDVNINESAARTLEYAYDDWCIAQFASHIGRPQEEIDRFTSRSQNYRNLFDPSTRLMRGKLSDGSFETPFSPYKWGGVFTEGNAWHYTWSVFHDVEGLQELMGGRDGFCQMLDSVFVVPPIYDDSYYGFRIHEITEMQVANMGNYAHGNQPAQHVIYLYDYADQPWKAQWHAREVMDRLYSANPNGYCGDEDNGQTSAWYVFSAMGFYPVCPGSGEYALGSPLFKKLTLHQENGKVVTINASDNSPENRYVKNLRIDGKPWCGNFVTLSELREGATLDFEMVSEPMEK